MWRCLWRFVAGEFSERVLVTNMAGKKSFRIGRVRGDLRGKAWYLTYHEEGVRHRPRVGPSLDEAKQLAAQINAQLEAGATAALSFESLTIEELRRRWLDHHEQILRSSLQTINRYRTATDHLLRFIEQSRGAGTTSSFRTTHAEQFVRYLRTVQVAPNGHPHSQKRPLLDKGVKYILLCCRTLFHFAIKRRYLSAYAENPFTALELDRMPVEIVRPVTIFSSDDERRFLEACDDWQFPLFLTLMLTGMRPGELCHLLLPDDLDLQNAIVHVRNKPELGWQVKTRNERSIPLVRPLVKILTIMLAGRQSGPVFVRRTFLPRIGEEHDGKAYNVNDLFRRANARLAEARLVNNQELSRAKKQSIIRTVWRDLGVLKTDRIRNEFIRLTKQIGCPAMTAPKALRHLFATCLQEGNVDPLIRCELMGHSISTHQSASHGLGMTATYTQTRLETKRTQLEAAMDNRPATVFARQWIKSRSSC